MPVELQDAVALRKALKQYNPELAKETQKGNCQKSSQGNKSSKRLCAFWLTFEWLGQSDWYLGVKRAGL
jgi:hypothetical protein